MSDMLWRESKVGSINDPNAKTRLYIKGVPEELWLTGLKGSVEPNYQIMYSLGSVAYINSFAQRLSMFSISGIYVSNICDGGSKKPAYIDFYKKRNITNNVRTSITFEGMTIKGYVVRLSIGDVTKEGIDGHTFQLDFLGEIQGIS